MQICTTVTNSYINNVLKDRLCVMTSNKPLIVWCGTVCGVVRDYVNLKIPLAVNCLGVTFGSLVLHQNMILIENLRIN